MMTILDGKGSGKTAEVNAKNRLEVDSTTHTAAQDAAENGKFFQVGAPLINLTSANESAILFIKNTSDEDIEVVAANFASQGSTGGASPMYETFLYRNPTSISSATTASITNTNFGSNNTLDGTFQYGAEASSITGGTVAGTTLFKEEQRERVELYWIIPKGSSLAISVKPAASNTSFNVTCYLECYLS